MKRKMIAMTLTVCLCLMLTGTVFAADSGGASRFVNPLWIVICLVIGFVLALIPMSILKGQIRNVHSKTEASDYTRAGSFDLQLKQDTFLYKNVSRTPIPKSKDNNK